MKPCPPKRLFYLDFSRTVLLLLGIVLHAAWLYRDSSPLLAGVHDFIHSFRMHSFFLLAGFFAAMMHVKYPPEQFLLRRLRRLGIPLLVFGFIIDPLLNCANIDHWSDFSLELRYRYWAYGEWFQHLWFLSVLIQYIFIVFFIAKIFPALFEIVRRKSLGISFLLIATAVGYAACLRVPLPTFELVFVRPDETLKFCVFFAVGFYFYFHQDSLDALVNKVWGNLAFVILFMLVFRSVSQFENQSIYNVLSGTYSLLTCMLLFWLARRFFNRPSPAVQKLSLASYTIYLVHWPLMIVVLRLIQPLNLPVYVNVLMLIGLTFGGSYLLHDLLVLRSENIAYLLNGSLRKQLIPKERLYNT